MLVTPNNFSTRVLAMVRQTNHVQAIDLDDVVAKKRSLWSISAADFGFTILTV
jgi:hypothetical protein